ncbi:MAG TPA: peptide-methionine (R)-S-oxide reductase MsrB [Sphingomicrobium sp.]|nr:peptide-methionine (R)-S-oxide reductase MsrB [Sphingomicrobium sp.]
MSKRGFLSTALGGGIGALLLANCRGKADAETTEHFEINLTPAQWKARLTPAQYDVLRNHNTERSGSSPLDHEFRKGIYACAGCKLPVYNSSAKFDSGTGWPSFFTPIKGAVRTRPDRGLIFARTEVHCRRCGGHLGHVFDDGPPPTGKRYCMNGVAMTFIPA